MTYLSKPLFQKLYGTNRNEVDPFIPVPARGKPMLRIYGDVLYPTAVAYGAGRIDAILREVAPPLLDTDGDGKALPLTDGLVFMRYLFGFRGATLIQGAVDTVNCTRCDAASVEEHIAEQLDEELAGLRADFDGDGEMLPLTDGLAFVRYLFGFRGAALVQNAVDPVDCTRCDAVALEGYMGDVMQQ
jgi:hypothetical protein